VRQEPVDRFGRQPVARPGDGQRLAEGLLDDGFVEQADILLDGEDRARRPLAGGKFLPARKRPSSPLSPPAYMQTGMLSACDWRSIQSMCSDRPSGRGRSSTRKAPAPSDSIQRRKSSKAISGLSSISARWADSGSYRRASRPPEARSEPLASAFACPARTDR
jgi:hypothetical protein